MHMGWVKSMFKVRTVTRNELVGPWRRFVHPRGDLCRSDLSLVILARGFTGIHLANAHEAIASPKR